MDNTMNINAKHGAFVKFSFPNNGWPNDQETAQKHLKLDEIYCVSYTRIHDFSTEVYLEGFPGVSFNSVMFSDWPVGAIARA